MSLSYRPTCLWLLRYHTCSEGPYFTTQGITLANTKLHLGECLPFFFRNPLHSTMSLSPSVVDLSFAAILKSTAYIYLSPRFQTEQSISAFWPHRHLLLLVLGSHLQLLDTAGYCWQTTCQPDGSKTNNSLTTTTRTDWLPTTTLRTTTTELSLLACY